jgi:hypothetical protein
MLDTPMMDDASAFHHTFKIPMLTLCDVSLALLPLAMMLFAPLDTTAKSWTSVFDAFLMTTLFPAVVLTSDAPIHSSARLTLLQEDPIATAPTDLLDLIADSEDAGL